MFYYLYQITNLVNNKIYVGVHKSKSLDDGYMGSGKVIKRAIKKYGIDNFKKDILEIFYTSESMYAKEKEIVTNEFVLREDTYNLLIGGKGGFDYINNNNLRVSDYWNKNPILHKIKSSLGGNNCFRRKSGVHNPNYIQKGWTDKARLSASISLKSPDVMKKRKETFKQIQHSQGIKNSQFGTMWITNNLENKKIKKTDILPIGWKIGRTIKK